MLSVGIERPFGPLSLHFLNYLAIFKYLAKFQVKSFVLVF